MPTKKLRGLLKKGLLYILLITFFLTWVPTAFAVETFTGLGLRGMYDTNVYFEPNSVTDDYALQFEGDATLVGGPSLTNTFFVGAGGAISNYFGEQFQRYLASATTGWIHRFSLWSDSQLAFDYFYTDNTGEELDWQTSQGYALRERLSLRFTTSLWCLINASAGTAAYPFYPDVTFERGRNDEYLLGSLTLQWLYDELRTELAYTYQLRDSDDKTADFDAHIVSPGLSLDVGDWQFSAHASFGLYRFPDGYFDYETFTYSSCENQYFAAETGIAYRISRLFSTGAGYNYSQVDSSEDISNYHRSEVSLYLRWDTSF